MKEAEKIFNKKETPEEKEERLRRLQEERDDRLRKKMEECEDRRDKKRTREVATVANQTKPEAGSPDRMGDRRRPRVDRNQCAYCKEKGHWVKDCLKRPRNPRKQPAQLLVLDED